MSLPCDACLHLDLTNQIIDPATEVDTSATIRASVAMSHTEYDAGNLPTSWVCGSYCPACASWVLGRGKCPDTGEWAEHHLACLRCFKLTGFVFVTGHEGACVVGALEVS